MKNFIPQCVSLLFLLLLIQNIFAQANNCETLQLNIDKQNVACGQDDGSAFVSVEGGTPPYTFLWSMGSTENFIDNLPVGIYDLTVRDAEECEFKAFVVIQEVDSPTLNIQTETSICGLERGSAKAFVEGGFPPYNYQWDNGSTSNSIDNLTTGDYSVIVKDSRNCEVEQSFNIKNSQIIVDIFDSVCSSNETIPLELLHEDGVWSGNGVFFEEGQYLFNPIEEGVGTVELSYFVEGCEPAMAYITINSSPNASFEVPSEIPNGFHCIHDGDIVFAVLGDEGGTFFIDGSPIQGNVWTPIDEGIFTIVYEVERDNNCISREEKQLQVANLFNPNWKVMDKGFTVCESDLPLLLEIEMMGGTWKSDINSSILLQDGLIYFDADIDNADHGAFSVTYEGGGQNCGQAQTHVINVYNIPKAPEVTYSSQIACASEGIFLEMTGDPSFCNCPVHFNVYAENGELVYEGQTYNDDVVDLRLFVKETGTHKFEVVTKNKVCESEVIEVVFEVESVLDIEVESVEPDCINGNGSLTVVASGGSGDYLYSWSNGVIGTENLHLEGGDYVVIVTDSEGCTLAESFSLSPLNTPIVELGGGQILEEGQTIVLNAGNAEATFLWSTGETTQMINVFSTGIYTVTVTNQEGCSASDSILIQEEVEVEIGDIEGLEVWNLYPNPFHNQLTLNLDLNKNTNLEIQVLDVSGREILRQNHSLQNGNHQLHFNTSQWVSGVYWVLLKDGKGVLVSKLLNSKF
ncbi:MAG: T9SS type A sorting domain-containing protein [Chitinophagales bacterium]